MGGEGRRVYEYKSKCDTLAALCRSVDFVWELHLFDSTVRFQMSPQMFVLHCVFSTLGKVYEYRSKCDALAALAGAAGGVGSILCGSGRLCPRPWYTVYTIHASTPENEKF